MQKISGSTAWVKLEGALGIVQPFDCCHLQIISTGLRKHLDSSLQHNRLTALQKSRLPVMLNEYKLSKVSEMLSDEQIIAGFHHLRLRSEHALDGLGDSQLIFLSPAEMQTIVF